MTVSWIVAVVLCGSTFLIAASPDSSQVDLGTSNAIQNPIKGPTVNRSDAVHPLGLSEVELPQRISKFSRRSKRDTVEASAIAGLNIFGIGVSVAAPLSGSCILILATLLQLIFSGNHDPMKVFQDIVWNERVKQQKLRLISIRDTMNEIKRQYETTTNILIPHGRMLTLYDILKSQRCLFMHDDNIEASADYFSEFALIHIAINQDLILIYPDERIFQESLVKIVKEYVAYAKHAQQIETQHNMNRKPAVTRVRSLLDPHIYNWTKQLSDHMQSGLNEQGLIRNGEVVSFKVEQPGPWLSCWITGSKCKLGYCPGQDNPMERGSKYDNHWRCRGEVFWIEPIDDTDGFVRSCSRVGIKYSRKFNKDWWLSTECAVGVGCRARTRSCEPTKLRKGECPNEVWTIKAKDKPCGHVIQDRDVVELLGYKYRNQRSFPQLRYVFIIFRSNVDHGEYKKDLVCHG